jgi:hypothetical protein
VGFLSVDGQWCLSMYNFLPHYIPFRRQQVFK